MLFAAMCMDLEFIILSEVSQRKTKIIQYHYVKYKKITDEFIYKTETDPQTQKTNLWLPKVK